MNKNYIYQSIFIFFCFYIFFISCASLTNDTKSNFISIRKITQLPIVSDQFELKFMLDTNYIIYYKNFIVITEKVENSNDKIYLQSNRVIKHRYSSFEYFVYKTGWDSGYYYKKINDSLPTKISIVEKLKINDFSDYDFYVITNDIKFINEKKINSNELEKEFVSKNLNALGCYDTGYFYFTKDFPDKVYNLSKKFQTNEGLKLTRFRLKPGCLINEIKINNENKSPSFDYWITKDTLQNISEVLTLIDNFSKKNLK